jgi:Anti-sigma factor NepR
MEMKTRKPGGAGSAMQAQLEGKREPSLGRDIRTKIGQQLRAMYDDVVNQGVPDRFVELLDRLHKQDGKQ